jgi:hypothetical protein
VSGFYLALRQGFARRESASESQRGRIREQHG